MFLVNETLSVVYGFKHFEYLFSHNNKGFLENINI